MPQSRHRKINPRKKQREQRAKSSHGPSLTGNRNVKIGAVILAAVIALVAVAYFFSLRNRGRATDDAGAITTASGLQYIDEKIGDGPTPQKGQTISVNYIGMTKSDQREFENSYKRGAPIDFKLGLGEVIPGWEEGLSTMKVGGKRKLIIPSKLAYGREGRPGIPPNSDLEFVVELMAIK